MSKRREEFCCHLRNLIVSDCKNKLSYRKIAEKYKVSKSAVYKIYAKYLQHNTVKNLHGRGRKRNTSAYDDRRIVRESRHNPSTTSRNIVEQLKLNISSRTVRRRLKEAGLKSYVARRKPHISKVNKKKRLAFAKKYINKPLSFWKQVIWSDESKFELLNKKKRTHVWRKPNEALKKQYVLPTVKHGGGSIMIWACFSRYGVGNLVPIHGIMNADRYIDILSENLEESVLKMDLDEEWIFQQDNDPKHTAKKTKQFFQDCKIKVLEWPPQSPDLNPIENLWSLLDAGIPLEKRHNKEEFLNELQLKFKRIDKNYLEKLVESVPRRLQAVIKAKGYNTKY